MSASVEGERSDRSGLERLPAKYPNAASLITALTQALSRGTSLLPAQRPVAIGRQFVLELSTPQFPEVVEVLARIVSLQRAPEGWTLKVAYAPGAAKSGLEALLDALQRAQANDPRRRHPRLPIHLRTTGEGRGPAYVVKNLSRGGFATRVEQAALPPEVRVGVPFLAEIPSEGEPVRLHGEVIWTHGASTFGASFGRLSPPAAEQVGQLLSLRSLKALGGAKLFFGLDAVSRMP